MQKHRIFLIIILLALTSLTAKAAVWTLVKMHKRDYLSLTNISQFYHLGAVHREGKRFALRGSLHSLQGTVGSSEFYINNLKFILSYPVEESDGRLLVSRMDLSKIIEPVLRPNRIKNARSITTIILDPGHGGHDTGARSRWGNEKKFALDVARRAKPLLEAEGFRVYLTRNSDKFVTLAARSTFANHHPNALFISIHFNSGQSHANGIETFTLAPYGVPTMSDNGADISKFTRCPGNQCDDQNMALACAVHAVLISKCGMFDRGIKRARFSVLRHLRIPGVLVEGGFLSNGHDVQKIITASYRETLARSIAQGAENYRRAVAPAAPPPTFSEESGEENASHASGHEPKVILNAEP